MSLAVWTSDSGLGFSSEGFWESVVVTVVVVGVVILVSVGCLAAVGANGPLPPVPACGFWV